MILRLADGLINWIVDRVHDRRGLAPIKHRDPFLALQRFDDLTGLLAEIHK